MKLEKTYVTILQVISLAIFLLAILQDRITWLADWSELELYALSFWCYLNALSIKMTIMERSL